MAFPIIIVPIAIAVAVMFGGKGGGKSSGIIPPCRGRISSRYGMRTHPVTGAQNLHKGMDVAVPTGTPLVTVYDGTVIKSTSDTTSGNYVKIDHGQGIETLYMHMSRRDVQTGQKVRKGQTIGLSGATGRVTGPHLHFEVRKGGTAIDPLKVIPESLFS